MPQETLQDLLDAYAPYNLDPHLPATINQMKEHLAAWEAKNHPASQQAQLAIRKILEVFDEPA